MEPVAILLTVHIVFLWLKYSHIYKNKHGTIHLRRQPIFTIFEPYPHPSTLILSTLLFCNAFWPRTGVIFTCVVLKCLYFYCNSLMCYICLSFSFWPWVFAQWGQILNKFEFKFYTHILSRHILHQKLQFNKT